MKYFFSLLICLGLLFSCSEKGPQNIPEIKPDTVVVKKAGMDSAYAAIQSEITCPKCGFKKKEIMPTDVCLLKYTCTSCRAELFPKEGDCCVFCTYGTYKCPSKQ
jgi:rubredoxin